MNHRSHRSKSALLGLLSAGLTCVGAIPVILPFMVSPSAAADHAASETSGDPVHGKILYQACTACHSIDENDIGPKHRGVFGRRAATVADYAYSTALKNSGLTWDEKTLDRWLASPSELVPGTKMFFKFDDPGNRADVIAYLKELN